MRKLILAALWVIAVILVWLQRRSHPVSDPPAGETIDRTSAARQPIAVKPSPVSRGNNRQGTDLTRPSPTTFDGQSFLVETNTPYARDSAMFLNSWRYSLTDEQKRRVAEAIIRVREARAEYEDSITVVDRSIPGVTSISIPAYPKSGKALEDVFNAEIASVLPTDRAEEFKIDFTAILLDWNDGLGMVARQIIVTRKDDGAPSPMFEIRDLSRGKTTVLPESQLVQNRYGYLVAYLPK